MKNEYTNITQQQLAAIQAQQQPQGPVGGTPNVNKIVGFGGSSTGPSSIPPSRVGAGNTLATPKATQSTSDGNVMRGSLGRTN